MTEKLAGTVGVMGVVALYLGIIVGRVWLGMFFIQSFLESIGKDLPNIADALISLFFFEVSFVLWIVSLFI